MNKILTALQNNLAISVSFLIAGIVVTLRAIQEKSGLLAAIIDIIIAGLAAPTVVWLLWDTAPFPVYGLVAAIVGRYPDIAKLVVNKYVKKDGNN